MKDISEKIVYQIYPSSFYDSNHDGIGDIKGICQKLDYLAYLGVDYLWINPFFKSPKNDNGYDVSDYTAIDASFGTMEDVEELIFEAKKRNIFLMFDMVFNHTSTEHTWFQEALKGNQKYKDYYIFKAPVDGAMPTNWESKFGGPVWEYVEKMDEYYLHLFDKTQADLNWENPEVRNELKNVVQFWIDKGVKGFRFDVINLISKEAYENDYEGVGKKFYTDRKKVHDYLRELNLSTFGNEPDFLTVGEMSSTTIENCIMYSNPNNNELDMTFNFHHLKVDYLNGEKWTLKDFDFFELKKLFNDWQLGMQKDNGWNALFWNCHDQPRSISRFGCDKTYHKESAKMLATVIHFLRGTPYIYQGEEIGMTNNYFKSIEQYKDVESINYFNILKNEGLDHDRIIKTLQAKSRDNARSPMQWTKDGGFSKSEPWIKMNPNCASINIEAAISDEDSILNYYRQLIQLRKNHAIISKGAYVEYQMQHPEVYAYKRILGDEELLVINNFYGVNATFQVENIYQYELMLSNYSHHTFTPDLHLRPYESIVLKRKN